MTATAKSTGQRRRNPSKQNWNVCRLHGAGGGAPRGEKLVSGHLDRTRMKWPLLRFADVHRKVV